MLVMDEVPYLDKKDIDELSLTESERFWRRNGYFVVNDVASNETLDCYEDPNKVLEITLSMKIIIAIKDFLGGDMALYHICKEIPEEWHTDFEKTQDLWHVGCMILLEDTDLTKGCLDFIPSSHKLESNPAKKKGHKTWQFQGKKGEAMLWHSKLWHKANDNPKAIFAYYSIVISHKSGPNYKEHISGGKYVIS